MTPKISTLTLEVRTRGLFFLTIVLYYYIIFIHFTWWET